MAKNQIKKLKNLILNSVDLCRIGANPKAHICLTKSCDDEKESDELQIFKNIALSISKALGIKESDENISKMTDAITEALIQSEEQKIKKSMFNSIESIMKDSNANEEEKAKIFEKSVSEFFTVVCDFANDSKNESSNKDTNLNKSIGDDKNMIDINKMTPEDKTSYESLMKKYSSEIEQTKNNEQLQTQKSVDNTNDLKVNPEVKKALDDVKKAQAELEEIKKSYEIKNLELVARKYEIIGKKSDELAPKLYEMKKSNEKAYNEFVSLLDEQVAIVEKSGLFTEIGTSRSGETSVNKQLEQRIQEIMKSDTKTTYEQAFVKACDENVELKKSFI